MPAWVLAEWLEFWDQEPWGSWRDNYHTSLIATILARVNGASSVNAADFFYTPPDHRSQGEQSGTTLLTWLNAVAKKAPTDGKPS